MDSQGRNHQNEPTPAVEDEWEIVSANWWHTPFTSVSWSYEPEKAPQGIVCAKPPHYHLSLYNQPDQGPFQKEGNAGEISRTPGEWHSASSCRIVGEDNQLSEELIGVKDASDVMKMYEKAVGFDYSPCPESCLEDADKKTEPHPQVSEMDVKMGKQRWDELVGDLLGGVSLQDLLEEAREKPMSTRQPFGRQLTLPGTRVDYFSRPSTPKPFRLNPSASSFVPLGSPTSTFSSSSYSSISSESSDRSGLFSFPLLNSSLPLPTPNKDLQGYMNSLPSRSRTASSDSSTAGNDRPSSNFLPPFLFEPANQRRRPARTSRTRAIVDQLRSQHHQDVTPSSVPSQNSSPTVSDFGGNNLNLTKSQVTVPEDGVIGSRADTYSTAPILEEEQSYSERVDAVSWNDNVEGWTIPPVPVPVDPETKRTRSKELLMTLRRRTDSQSSNATSATSLLGARSLGVVSASTPSVISEPERLVESPEPTEHTLAEEEANFSHFEEKDGWVERPDQSQDENSRNFLSTPHHSSQGSISSTLSNSPSSPGSTSTHLSNHAQGQRNTRSQTHLPYAHALPAPKYPTGYFPNPAPGMPYTLLGLPLSMSMNMPIPMSMAGIPMAMTMGTPHVTVQTPMPVPMQVPVQVPVQTMQYSTLMHLRIMQQMQMMRNSMGMSAGVGMAGAGVTR
ncbi:hypothetical protein P691DRAFT_225369 [Macrolepiota fuliginosa MF-IS2]|uniref:Uncharacterized protein n=1 Tax=Macrolepiota fuliginosa MF-IS2 TaxID=1400762 RepID=A0A9P5XB96_9AGAR|nr:hypothetical protein P691DRAFT_225369 [Macrolepiota fuliginosa MF-IS2]